MRNTSHAILISGLLAATAMVALLLIAPHVRVPAETLPETHESAPQPEPQPVPTADTKMYTNAKYGFSVAYPEIIQPTEDKPDMQLSGYIPVCDPDNAIACFPFAKETYKDTNFESAAFAVHVRSDLKKPTTCTASSNGEIIDGEATINGVAYKKFSFGDAAAGHRLEGENYRTYRNGACIELSTRVATTVFENYEPGAIVRFTDEDRSSLQAALDAMLKSFRFVSGS